MKYWNASAVLPPSLVEELQKYVQAGYLYVPARAGRRRRWGELSGYRQELDARNRAIVQQYRAGASPEALAGAYGLSVSAIRKILYRK